MKPLLTLLLLVLLAGCNIRSKSSAANAVCTTVVDCCKSVGSVNASAKEGCPEKSPSAADRLFSVSMHEITNEIFTW